MLENIKQNIFANNTFHTNVFKDLLDKLFVSDENLIINS